MTDNEKAIAENLGSGKISHDTWLHKAVGVGVKPLVNSPVTPNHLTTLRLATGVLAAAAYGIGEQSWHYAGSALFLVSILLDRADGLLARLSAKTSRGGHIYDLWSDSACNSLVFVGIGVGLRGGVLGNWAILMGLIAGGAIVAVLALVMASEKRQGKGAAELGGVGGFDADDAMIGVPVVMAFGGATPLLTAAVIGAPGFAALFLWRYRRLLRT